MNYIKLREINLTDSYTVLFSYSISTDLKRFFTEKPFFIEYPKSINDVPKSILAIPFVCNVLPIIWLTDSLLELDELDEFFFESIAEFKKGYINMYPKAEFKGEIKVKRIVKNSYATNNKVAMFFSGGLDSVSTLISHLNENPILLSIWGSDISYDNESGWNLVHSAINEASEEFSLDEYVIKSTFREFDREQELTREFSKYLGDGWWHGVKHGIGLLGNAAPLLYIMKISTVYIASSFSPKYGFNTCASDPTIDNYVKFSGCSVVHDGYEYSRQDKINRIVSFSRLHHKKIQLHVCWESQQGSNCCRCEKCVRTIAGLWAEGEDPVDYGFENIDLGIAYSYSIIFEKANSSYLVKTFYPEIQEAANKNKKELKKSKYYKYLKWILTTDFKHPETLKMPLNYRIRCHLSQFSFYKYLHKLKQKLKKQ